MGEEGSGVKEIDTKRYAKIEKIPGGTIEESRVLDGVMFNKDVTHPKGRIEHSNMTSNSSYSRNLYSYRVTNLLLADFGWVDIDFGSFYQGL